MSKSLFVTGTGTDIGKTYVTALIVKKIRESGYKAGYYKAALSGSDNILQSDAGYVKKFSGISQTDDTLLSYLYQNAVSPHLAARMEKNSIKMEKIIQDYCGVKKMCDYVTVEGSGGIVCPIRWDTDKKILLEDIVKNMGLSSVVIADAGLGTINATVLTVEYMKQRNMKVKGIILNRFSGGMMQEDNITMIETLTKLPVLTCVCPGDQQLRIDMETLLSLYE